MRDMVKTISFVLTSVILNLKENSVQRHTENASDVAMSLEQILLT